MIVKRVPIHPVPLSKNSHLSQNLEHNPLELKLSKNLPATTNGVTHPPVNYVIKIELNENTLGQRPTLMVARTIIHEMIHAEMFRKLLSIANNGGNLGGLNSQDVYNMLSNGDFPGIFKYYKLYGGNFQHQQMAEHYLNVIADALANFDNNQNSYQFYKDISWVGLKGTDAWLNLSSTERQRISNVINNYLQNGKTTC